VKKTTNSPEHGDELLYAVLVQLLDSSRRMETILGDVASWQREFRVVNNLSDTRRGLDELKQVKQESAIRG
jgi:hypothetical protein